MSAVLFQIETKGRPERPDKQDIAEGPFLGDY